MSLRTRGAVACALALLVTGCSSDPPEIDAPDLTVTVEYDTAKALFVDLDVTQAMQAFMAGKVKVQGDITKLMALGAPQAAEPDEKAVAIAKAVRDITAP